MGRDNTEMPRWEISARTLPTVIVQAPNWMAAVGTALERLGRIGGMQRVACERLSNGAIIVNDISTGLRLTARPVLPGEAVPAGTPLLDWMLDCVCDLAMPLGIAH